MKRSRPNIGVVATLVLLLAMSLVHFTGPITQTAGDPSIIDLGTGNKTASWTFTNPADYTSTDVVFSGGISLNTTGGSLLQDTTTDFQGNGTWDMTNLTVTGDSIATNESRTELVQNGNFTSGAQWTYTSSSDGNVSAGWDAVNESGSLSHGRPSTTSVQVDSMDTGFGTTWSVSLTGTPPHLLNDAFQDLINFTEGIASVQLDVRFRGDINGLCSLSRDFASLDWTAYNTLSMWFNTSYGGPQVLQSFVHLDAGMNQWDSSRINVTPGWQRYDFDMSNFTARNAVTHIDIHFTNLQGVTPVKIWTDDIHLSRYEKGSRFGELHQVVNKADWTDPLAGTLLLLFNYRVDVPSNLVSANLTVFINGAPVSVPPLSVLAPIPWTPMSYDVSAVMSSSGAYNLSFGLDVTFNTGLSSSVKVQVDDVSITVPEHHGGVYESIAFDLGGAHMFDFVSWSSSVHPDTSVLVEVRAGYSSNTSDGSWTAYEPHTTQPEQYLPLPATGSFLQYRVTLATTNTSASVSVDWVSFTFHRYRDSGSVETFDFTPPEQLIQWHDFGGSFTEPLETTVAFFASDDTGASWNPVNPGTSLSFLTGQQMRLRADLSTINTTRTPLVMEMNVTYEFEGTPFAMSISPLTWSGTADEQVQFTASAWDQWSHPVTINFTWTDDDAAGSVDMTGLYSAGTVGSHVVCASNALYSLIDCANVTVALGVLARIDVNPPSQTVNASDQQWFTAEGFDSDGNPIVLTTTVWTTNVGVFDFSSPDFAILRAQGVPGSGYVRATQSGITGEALVTVTSSSSIYIRNVVPNQLKPEDSPTWSIDLSNNLPPGPPADQLMWYLTDVNTSMYTVFGEKRFGQHNLWFTPKPDAYGNDQAVLWLENKTGARDSQNIWVNLTPVNDAPLFYDVPPLAVRTDTPYVFDYRPYIYDVDDPLSSLLLTTNDPARARVMGLTVNYTYDSSFRDQTVLVRLRINDGILSSDTIQTIKVTDDPGVQIIAPLPPITMFEDTPSVDVFPSTLNDYFYDPDGDALNFSMVYSPNLVASFWPAGTRDHLTLTPREDWFGVECITIRATDTAGMIGEQKVDVTVLPVNDPPVLGWHEDLNVKFDTVYTLDLSDFVSDIDDPYSSLMLSANRSDIVTVEQFRLHVMVPAYLFQSNPVQPLSIELTDGKAVTYSNITVRASDNEPPRLLSGMPNVEFNEDEQAIRVFDAKNYFIDQDGGPQPLTFSVQTVVLSSSIDTRNDRAFLNFSAPPDWCGTEVVYIRASDGVSFAMGRVNVRVVCVNDAPVVSPLPNMDMGTGGTQVIDLRFYVFDIDNNISELFFTTNSPRVIAYGYMLVLDYTMYDISEDVTFTANDSDKQASRTFHVTVRSGSDDGGGGPDWGAYMLFGVSAVLVVFTILGALVYRRVQDRRYCVEDLFLIAEDGRLIMHNTRHMRADRDEDAIAHTLAAIKSFIRDSFEELGAEMRSFGFNEKNIAIQKGANFYVAGIYAQEPPENAPLSFKDFADDIELEFGALLDDWSGDPNVTRGLRAFMDAFVAHKRYKSGDWKSFARGRK